eukprot:jgi/Chlat1/3848/Chrsp26S04059
MSAAPKPSTAKAPAEEENKADVCGGEALALLNCIAGKEYKPDKCMALMAKLRECVLAQGVKDFTSEPCDCEELPQLSRSTHSNSGSAG